MKLCPLLFFLVTLAKAIELESSKSEDQIGIRGGKFLVYTTTSTTTVFTSTLTVLFSTYRSCYTTLNAMSTCSVTTVGLPFITSGTTGRKKRSLIEQRPVIKREDGQVVDFRPSKVQEVETFQTAGPEEAEERHPRLLTVLTTATVNANTTITITTTPLEVEYLAFTSTDANHCLPADLLATIPPCI